MKRSKKTLKVFAILFGVIGISLFLTFGVIGFRYLLVYNNRDIAYAKVIEINRNQGYTLVRYDIDNQTYNRKLRMLDSSWYEGKYITVIYDKDEPSKSFIKNQAITALFMTIAGAVFSFLSLAMALILRSYIKKKKYLLKHGKKIEAKIDKLSINNAIHFKGKNPYQIELSYKEGNKVYHFIHTELWFDVKQLIEDKKLETVEVLVDPDNYDNYYINLGRYGKKKKNVKKRK